MEVRVTSLFQTKFNGAARRAGWIGYVAGAGCIGLAALARLSLDSLLGQEVLPFSFFYLAVAVTAWSFGPRPALLSMGLGLLAGLWLIIPPRHSLAVHGLPNLIEVALYLVISGVVVLLISSLRAAREAALEQQNKLEAEIYQRAETQSALRRSEQGFCAMAETVPDILFIYRPDGSAEYANPRFYEYTGISPGAAGGLGWSAALHPEDAPRVQAALQEEPATVQTQEIEYRFRRADGEYHWFLEHRRPICDDRGRIVKWVAVCRDIDDRKRSRELLEQKIQERTARLREMVSELEHFSYALIHDMRAPLRSMQSFAGLIEEENGERLPEPSREYLRRIKVAANRMDQLIRDSFNYSRTVRAMVPRQPVDLSKLLVELLETYPNLKPHQARIEIQNPLPVVWGSEAALTQCFSNLLGNAVKFVAPGTKPRVRVWAEGERGRVRVWVEDNGVGIPIQAQSRLFRMFQRHHPQYEGTGVGLAIVRKLIDRMGGRVGVESGENRGSRFWIELATAPLRGERTSPPHLRTELTESGRQLQPHQL